MFITEGRLSDPERSAPRQWCTIERTLQVVGTRAALVVMREAAYGTARFDDFVRRTGFSEAVVAQRLRELADAGLLEKTPYREPGSRTRHEYRLTDAGDDLLPALVALADWGERHLPRNHGPEYHHVDCGARVHAALLCDAGHPVTADEVVARA